MRKSTFKLRYLLYSKILFILGVVFLILSGCRTKKANVKENLSQKSTDTLSIFDVNDTIKCIAIYGVIQTVYKPIETNKLEPEDENPEFQERDDAVKF